MPFNDVLVLYTLLLVLAAVCGSFFGSTTVVKYRVLSIVLGVVAPMLPAIYIFAASLAVKMRVLEFQGKSLSFDDYVTSGLVFLLPLLVFGIAAVLAKALNHKGDPDPLSAR